MSLAIKLADCRTDLPLAARSVVEFDDDENGGYYWFLYPLFVQLAEKTGQLIELYGAAEFRGDALLLLQETLRKARRLVTEQSEEWSVDVGTQTLPNAPEQAPRTVFKKVERAKFVLLVDALLAIVELARSTGVAVVCFGD